MSKMKIENRKPPPEIVTRKTVPLYQANSYSSAAVTSKNKWPMCSLKSLVSMKLQ